MRKSTVQLVQILKAKLMEFPALVNRLERKDFSFVENLISWLKQCEDIMAEHNLTGAAELSGLRSKILSAKFSSDRSAPSRKSQLKIASEVLYDVQHVVGLELQPFEIKVEESRDLVRQLLVIVAQSGAVRFDAGLPFETLIDNIWTFINSNEQLRAGAIKLKSTLPATDIPILIADEINTEDFV